MMENLMEISNGLLIDLAINALGFLAAGGFSVLIYSAVLKRKQSESAFEAPQSTAEIVETNEAEPEQPTDRIELIQFGKDTDESRIDSKQSEVNSADSSRFQRNRLDVIRQAREMLNSGKAAHEIKRELPISSAELEFMGRSRAVSTGQVTDDG